MRAFAPAVLLAALCVPAGAQYQSTRVTVPRDEQAALLEARLQRRAAVNHQEYRVLDGPDGRFFVVIRDLGGSAFHEAGDIRVESYGLEAEVSWSGERMPVPVGDVNLTGRLSLQLNFVNTLLDGADGPYMIVQRADHRDVARGPTLQRCADEDAACQDRAELLLKPYLDAARRAF